MNTLRLQKIKKDVMSRKCTYDIMHNSKCGSWIKNANPWARDAALDGVIGDRSKSVVQLKARLLRELVDISRIEIYPDWSLAGEHLEGHMFFAGSEAEKVEKHAGRLAEYGLCADDIPRLVKNLESLQACRHINLGTPAFNKQSESITDDGRRLVYLARGWVENHSIRNFSKVIEKGFKGIYEEIEDTKKRIPIDSPKYPAMENFLDAALDVCRAGIDLGKRYSRKACLMAEKAENEEDRQRLLKMAETCSRVPARGAKGFLEAVQSLWLAHVLTCGEDGINANSIGLLDRILYPYYRMDMERGIIDRDYAVEVMVEFACKLYQDYDVQAITLGGKDSKGKDASNELTYIILEATEKAGFIRDVSVRLHKKSPIPLINKTAEMIALGGGIPFIFNDDSFIPALTERGIKPEDASNYAPIGCIELTIPGKANPHAVSAWFNSAKCLELALFDGYDFVSRKQLGLKTGKFKDFKSYDSFFDAYKKQVEYFAARMIYHTNRGELAQKEYGPLPCWSTLTDKCVPRGRDITDGGAEYNYHSVCFLGTANTADSLAALKKLYFEEKKISAEDLLKALKGNFRDSETLRLMLLNNAPKYGNDSLEVDSIAAEIDNHFINIMDKAESPLGGRYFVHLFSFILNLSFGAGLGATPDGRKKGEPLAYSLSAQQGRDEKGITAMLKSLSKLPHNRAAGASAAIVDIDPRLVSEYDGAEKIAQLISSAINMGVGQLQLNVVTEEKLRKAKKNPEKYGNIPVRVAGYSQLFRLLNEDIQEHVIARTKHRK